MISPDTVSRPAARLSVFVVMFRFNLLQARERTPPENRKGALGAES
jgi:hypothetical protein